MVTVVIPILYMRRLDGGQGTVSVGDGVQPCLLLAGPPEFCGQVRHAMPQPGRLVQLTHFQRVKIL